VFARRACGELLQDPYLELEHRRLIDFEHDRARRPVESVRTGVEAGGEEHDLAHTVVDGVPRCLVEELAADSEEVRQRAPGPVLAVGVGRVGMLPDGSAATTKASAYGSVVRLSWRWVSTALPAAVTAVAPTPVFTSHAFEASVMMRSFLRVRAAVRGHPR
jgi:hypothetical protein